MSKIINHRIVELTVRWTESWLNSKAQMVVIGSTKPSWKPDTRGVPHTSILWPVLFHIFINDLDDRTECNLSKFTDDTTPSVCCHLEMPQQAREIGKQDPQEVNTGQCQALHMGRNNPWHPYITGARQIDNSSSENGLRSWWTTS